MPEPMVSERLEQFETGPKPSLDQVNQLASLMLFMYGTPSQNSRDLMWADGDRTFLISRSDHTQWLGQQNEAETNWLHILDDDGEHSTFSLSGQDNDVQEPELIEHMAEIVRAQATKMIFEEAAARLKETELPRYERRKWFQLSHQKKEVTFYDFTDTEHDSFIWVRLHEMRPSRAEQLYSPDSYQSRYNSTDPEWAAYELTPDNLRIIDSVYPNGWPIQKSAMSQEAVLTWFLRALAEPSDKYYSDRRLLGSRGLSLDGRRIGAPNQDLDEHHVGSAIELGQELATYTNPEILSHEDDNRVVIQTIMPVKLAEYSAPKMALVGVVYEKNRQIIVQVADINPRIKTTLSLTLDIINRSAWGYRSVSADLVDSTRHLEGHDVIKDIFEILNSLSQASTSGQLVKPTELDLLHLSNPAFRHARQADKMRGPQI